MSGTPRIVMLCDVDLGRPDGSRTHTVEVARAFAATGFAVRLVARGPDPELPGVEYDGPERGELPRLARLAQVNGHAIRALVRERGDAIGLYVRKDWGSLPAIAAARLLRLRVVTEVNDLPYGRGAVRGSGAGALAADRFKRGAAHAIWRLSTRILTITEALRGILVSDYGVDPAKVAAIPVGVDAERFAPRDRAAAVQRAGLDPECVHVLFLGAFADWVDFDTLLRGFAAAARTRPATRLLLVGDGPRRADVDRLLREHDLEGRVVRTGFVRDRERVSDLIAASVACVLAHRVELLGRTGAGPSKLGEYAASGRAVVANAIPGVRDMVEDTGCGVLFAPGDAAALGDALGALLDDPAAADRLGETGRAAVLDRYTWPAVVQRILTLFG